MTAIRAARPLLLSLGAAVLLAGLLPATPAAAAGGGITAPGVDELVAAHAVVPLRAVVEGPVTSPTELTLTEPGSATEQVVAVTTSPGGGELAADLDTACGAVLCTTQVPARNGAWTLRLRGAVDDERAFHLRIPPAAPVDVRAEPAGPQVLLQWRRGAEPDLTGYDVESADGSPVLGGIALDACDADGRCRVEVPADAGAWTVVAHRRTCPGCATTLASPASDPVRVGDGAGSEGALPAPAPEPTASASPTARPDPGDQRDAFLAAFGAGAPAPAERPGEVARPEPAEAAQPDGTYDVELGYGAAAQPPGGQRPSLGQAVETLGSGARLPLMALSAVMVGGAVWLRRWARRAIAD